MVAKPGMNGLWNPKTPSVLRTSLTDFNIVGQSLIPVILLGSILISPCPRHTPRKSTSGYSKTHLDGFRKYKCSSNICKSLWFICLCVKLPWALLLDMSDLGVARVLEEVIVYQRLRLSVCLSRRRFGECLSFKTEGVRLH